MTNLDSQAAWVLTVAFLFSLTYEVYRATAKSGTSPYDSWQGFVKNNVALYAVAGVVIALLFADLEWAPWLGLTFSAAVIAASIIYYNPKIMVHREPGLIDWFEDIAFTGLLFLAAGLLSYQILGISLRP